MVRRRVALTLSCLIVLAAMGLGVWKGSRVNNQAPIEVILPDTSADTEDQPGQPRKKGEAAFIEVHGAALWVWLSKCIDVFDRLFLSPSIFRTRGASTLIIHRHLNATEVFRMVKVRALALACGGLEGMKLEEVEKLLGEPTIKFYSAALYLTWCDSGIFLVVSKGEVVSYTLYRPFE
jgi:hypothetical protein